MPSHLPHFSCALQIGMRILWGEGVILPCGGVGKWVVSGSEGYLELLIQDTCFCVLNCYCSIALLLSLWVDIERYRFVRYFFNLVLFRSEHNEVDCAFELELLIVSQFIVIFRNSFRP